MARRHFVILITLLILSPCVPETPTSTSESVQEAAGTVQPSEAVGGIEARSHVAPSTGVPAVEEEEPPEGYYAFVESPNATPPRVRPPPYRRVPVECDGGHSRPHVTAHNLCGDLNRGDIPNNPMGQLHNGEPYPFELIRNATLRFLSRALPVLRSDDTLPRVAHLPHTAHTASDDLTNNRLGDRGRRSFTFPEEDHEPTETPRNTKFCEGGGVFCMLYRAINGDGSGGTVERREDPGTPHGPHPAPNAANARYEGPPTPCPARVEYATPVFARNYQGVWRYVVQIPYEGYFTQTIEVTRCMQSRCHYLDGGCLSSPRWVSLLVAELHYPPHPAHPSHTAPSAPTAVTTPADFQEYQQFLQKRAGQVGEEPGDKPTHCDGHDELGCYQVRLYYDWFLVPGSCKCWRPDYFARYVRRRHTTNEL